LHLLLFFLLLLCSPPLAISSTDSELFREDFDGFVPAEEPVDCPFYCEIHHPDIDKKHTVIAGTLVDVSRG
jgi:hypothetical protein